MTLGVQADTNTAVCPFALRDYQLDGIRWLRDVRRGMLCDQPRLGKGGTLDTKVLTPTGWTTLGAIRVGDSVIGSDGEACKVTGVYPRGTLPVYRVTMQDGTSVLCDDDHLWATQNHHDRVYSNGFTRVKPLREIRKWLADNPRTRNQHFIPVVSPVQFADGNDLPIDAYVLGVLLGDGSISQRVPKFTASNIAIVEQVENALPDNVYVTRLASANSAPSYSLTTDPQSAPNPIKDALIALGLQGCNSGSKFIPDMYKLSGLLDREALLQGLLDTDGELRPDDGHVEYSTVSSRLCEDICFLVRSLGGTAKVATKLSTYTYLGEKRQGQMCYRITIHLPAHIVLSRVKNWNRSDRRPPYKAITHVEYEKDAEVICIAVDAPDNLYVTDDFIVTHNTVQAAFAAEPPVLIAAPSYLTWHWYDSLVSYGIDPRKIAHATGTHEERQAALDSPADWYICNIEMLRHFDPFVDEQGRARVPYHFQVPRTLIVDEAHHLRGRNSQQSKGTLRLATPNGSNGFTGAQYVFLLTGTPVLNRPDDLFAQLRLIDPKRFTSYWDFARDYCNVVDVGFGPQVKGHRDPNFYKPLRRVFERYSLTRTAEDVGLQLAPLTEQVIRVDPDAAWKLRYQRLKTLYIGMDGEDIANLSQAEWALRRATYMPKLRPLLSLMVDTHSEHGTIIFTKTKETAQELAKALDATCITGDVPPKDRRELVKDDLLVATIESISEGCDLSHINVSIFFEPDYIPGTRYQALERNKLATGHRHAYHLLVKGTIDEIIYDANDDRTKTAREIVREALTA